MAPVGTGGVDPGTEPIQPVGRGRTQYRTEVVIANSEGVGQQVMNRDVSTGVVAHCRRGVGGRTGPRLRRQPVVVRAAVPRLMDCDPIMVGIVDARAVEKGCSGGVETEREGDAGGIQRLGPRVPALCWNSGEAVSNPSISESVRSSDRRICFLALTARCARCRSADLSTARRRRPFRSPARLTT